MQCRDFRELADSYLSDELLVETNHEVLRHLETCAVCRVELAARRELRNKLRAGFDRAPGLQPSGEFANRMKAELREAALRRPGSRVARRVAYAAVAASLVIAATLGIRIAQQRWRSLDPPPVNKVANSDDNGHRPNTEVRTSLLSETRTERVVGDHRDCALNHRLRERPIGLDEAGRRYDHVYTNLVSTVMSEGTLPTGVELVDGHSCVFKGQRFGHVILKYHSKLISVLVTNAEAQGQGRSTGGEKLIATAQSDGYHIAHFENGRHAVYVVSTLNDTENLAIARAIAPAVSRHLKETAATA